MTERTRKESVSSADLFLLLLSLFLCYFKIIYHFIKMFINPTSVLYLHNYIHVHNVL